MDWKVKRIVNGRAASYEADGVRIVSVMSTDGFENWDVLFPNGKRCRQHTVTDAKAYAEAHASSNR